MVGPLLPLSPFTSPRIGPSASTPTSFTTSTQAAIRRSDTSTSLPSSRCWHEWRPACWASAPGRCGPFSAWVELGVSDRDLRPGHLDGRNVLVPLCPARSQSSALDLPRHHARDRARSQVHNHWFHSRHRCGGGAHSRTAVGAAYEVSVDRSCDRASHLGPEPRVAGGRGFSDAHVCHQPWRVRWRPARLPDPVRCLLLLPHTGVANRDGFGVPQSGAAANWNCQRRPTCLVPLRRQAYYAAGTVPVVVAQGLIAIANVRRPRFRRALTIAAMVAGVLDFVVFFFLVVPITPPDRIHATRLDTVNEVFADSVGWSDVANQVVTIYGSLPESERSSTVIISAYYGVPGALQVYVDPARRPAAYSPQLSDWYLLPPDLSPTYALMIDYRPSDVEWMCNSPTLIGHLTVPYQVMGLEQGAPITFCPLKASIQTDWGRLRNFS